MCGSKQQQACKECTKKCLKAHGKRPSSSVAATTPTPLSFFKVMIGDFEEAMFIPPKFAQTFRDLVNKNTHLEDSNGHHWRVRISVVDGSPAFQQGWRDFVSDHSIELGELVIFKYIGKSFFSVQIFATSACERLHFSERSNNNKRKRKRNKTEISPKLLHFENNNRSSEGSKEMLCAVEKDSDRAIEPVPYCVAKRAGEDLTAPERSPCDNSESLQIASPINYSEAPYGTNNGDAMRVEEAGKISFINLCDDEDTDIEIVTKDDSFPFVDNSRGLQTTCLLEYGNDGKGNLSISEFPLTEEHTSTVEHPEAPCNMVLESLEFEQEAIVIPPIDSLDPETTETQCYPQYTDILVMDEENLSHQDNNLRRSQTEPTVECSESDTKNKIEASCAIITYPLAEKGLSTVDCSQGQNLADTDWIREQGVQKIHALDLSDHEMIYNEPDAEEIFGTSFSRPRCADANCNADERGDLIAPNGVVRKFLITGEETCCNVDEDLMDKLEATRDAPIGVCHIERDDSVCPSDEVVMTRNKASVCEDSLDVSSGAAIINCNEDVKGNLVPSCEPINKDTQTKEQLGNVLAPGMVNGSSVETVESDPLTMPDVSEFHKNPIVMERDSCQTGIMPEDSPEVDDKKVDSCLQERAFGVVKIESTDSIDLQSPNDANFTFSVYVNAQSCLKLPERLPSCVVKKKLERRVVTLRDPKMRLWPVLYHESIKFVGFIGGWEEFTTANNLQKGDLCQFELANEPEPTFQMRSSKA